MNKKIDFVILWVDGNDPKWVADKNKFSDNKVSKIAQSNNRFRDWDNLKYWFRGVEKFAPWVNNIYFITYGHLPDFLDITNPKIKVINHSDYIDKNKLPVFNSNAIEIGINHIKGLSDNFVLFNDDMFFIKDVKEEDFFINNIPRDEYAENAIAPTKDVFTNFLFNNLAIINDNYNKREVHKKNFKKIYNLKYGLRNIRTLLLALNKNFVGFYNPHLPQSFTKSYFDRLWKIANKEASDTETHRFRNKDDISQYLVRYLQLADGHFIPRKSSFGKLLEIRDENIDSICDYIKKQKSHVVCLNDVDDNCDFEKNKKLLIDSFEEILPEKSSFEK